MREKWLKPGVYFRAAPVSGMFFPTTTDFVPYEEWVLGESKRSFYKTNLLRVFSGIHRFDHATSAFGTILLNAQV